MKDTPAEKILPGKVLKTLREYYSDHFGESCIFGLCKEFSHNVLLLTNIKLRNGSTTQVNYVFNKDDDTVRLVLISGAYSYSPLSVVIDLFNQDDNLMVYDLDPTPRSSEDDHNTCFRLVGQSEAFYPDPDDIINCLERVLDEVNAIDFMYKDMVSSKIGGNYSPEDLDFDIESNLYRIHRLLVASDIDETSFWEACKTNLPFVSEVPLAADRIAVYMNVEKYHLHVGTYAQDDPEEQERITRMARDMCLTIEEMVIEGF